MNKPNQDNDTELRSTIEKELFSLYEGVKAGADPAAISEWFQETEDNLVAQIKAHYISKSEIEEAIGEDEKVEFHPGHPHNDDPYIRNQLRQELREKLGL